MAGWNNSSLTRRLGSLHPAEENVTAPLLYFSLLSASFLSLLFFFFPLVTSEIITCHVMFLISSHLDAL